MHFGSLYLNNMDPDPDQTAPTGAAWLGFIVPMYFGSRYLNNMDPDLDQTAPTEAAELGFIVFASLMNAFLECTWIWTTDTIFWN